MAHFENSKLAGTKRLRISPLAFDPAPAKRASPPKSSARDRPSDKTPRFEIVSLRLRAPISAEEGCFSRWVDAESCGCHIPGLLLSEPHEDRFNALLWDPLVTAL